MAEMRVVIITGEKEVYSDSVDVLVAPGLEGDLGILPHHASLMTSLQPGEIMLRKGGQQSYLAISGGFLEVMNNKVTILADSCERADEIDEERARHAEKRARERLMTRESDINLDRAAAALRRAIVRLRVSSH